MTDDDIERNEKGWIPSSVLKKANDRAREAEARAKSGTTRERVRGESVNRETPAWGN